MNPAPLLRLAAQVMEDRARAASPGPYEAEGDQLESWVIGDDEIELAHLTGPRHEDDVRHFAGWSPPVAIQVARWLRSEAEVAETLSGNYRAWGGTSRGIGAVTIATEYLRLAGCTVPDDEDCMVVAPQPWSWN